MMTSAHSSAKETGQSRAPRAWDAVARAGHSQDVGAVAARAPDRLTVDTHGSVRE